MRGTRDRIAERFLGPRNYFMEGRRGHRVIEYEEVFYEELVDHLASE